MKILVKVGKVWRNADAVIDSRGNAIIKLPHPYGTASFSKNKWKKKNGRVSKTLRERGKGN